VQAFGSPWKLKSDEDMSVLVHSVWVLYFFDGCEFVFASSNRKIQYPAVMLSDVLRGFAILGAPLLLHILLDPLQLALGL
jgi:hypothetical protein